jgi:hypothetical protein
MLFLLSDCPVSIEAVYWEAYIASNGRAMVISDDDIML